ncbi:UDP-N-acetylglucosamine 2-epimerase (hydrolyzing) [bacterium]|nr:UDP-N-acetylglucosamine 2-epimerase (hydrolyzing) [bacterium]
MTKKKILFLTGTRADFGKLKSLIQISQSSSKYDVHIFATGMHMNSKYGCTVDEIEKSGFKNIFKYINHDTIEHMDRTLAKTIEGLSHYIYQLQPDMIVVHGDRVEAMAGAIVGSLNNILVTHIEGGEVSGTIDELIRHAVTKMSHIHLVSNEKAQRRLIQLGEKEESIFIVGSPDLDIMNSNRLPSLEEVKHHYNIKFDNYSLAMFHPITTEYDHIAVYANNFVQALIDSGKNYVLIYPNNDLGSNEILKAYEKIDDNSRFKVFPSLRFEYFLTLLKFSEFMIGNSSAGIREAPYYNVPTVDIGSRQLNRVNLKSVRNCGYELASISEAIKHVSNSVFNNSWKERHSFGKGRSDHLFFKLLESEEFWQIKCQKQFKDLAIT